MLMHTTLDDGFLRYSGRTTTHSHLPNPAQSEIRNLREKMRERAENEVAPLQEIAEQEVRKALLTGEALAVLPRVNDLGILYCLSWKKRFLVFRLNTGRHLTRSRRKMTSALPQSSSFAIPDTYTLDYRNVERLLLHDSDDPQHRANLSGDVLSAGRVLVWLSDTQLNLLFDSDRLHTDGTFSSAPPMFNQVFIIQAFVHETCELSYTTKRTLASSSHGLLFTIGVQSSMHFSAMESDNIHPFIQRPIWWSKAAE